MAQNVVRMPGFSRARVILGFQQTVRRTWVSDRADIELFTDSKVSVKYWVPPPLEFPDLDQAISWMKDCAQTHIEAEYARPGKIRIEFDIITPSQPSTS